MRGKSVADFLAYWEEEGLAYVKRGDYAWMAERIPVGPVLEIGCGLGFATQALLARGCRVLALDSLEACLAATQQRLAGDSAGVTFLQADVGELQAEQMSALGAFAPVSVVCWLMGAPAETTGATSATGGQAVAAYRERVHRAVAQLAASLPSVQYLHFVDRTAIPWQAKDIGRDTLVRYHQDKTLAGLPFSTAREQALYRKLGDKVVNIEQLRAQLQYQSHPALKHVVPTLASLLARRSQ